MVEVLEQPGLPAGHILPVSFAKSEPSGQLCHMMMKLSTSAAVGRILLKDLFKVAIISTVVDFVLS